MNRGARFVCLALLGLVLFAPLAARAQSDQQAVVDRARITIQDLSHDKAFGNARQLLHRARAVLIVPRLYKGGFIVGGEGGTGVMLVHGSGNTWSDPAFFAIGAASFGLQAGLEEFPCGDHSRKARSDDDDVGFQIPWRRHPHSFAANVGYRHAFLKSAWW